MPLWSIEKVAVKTIPPWERPSIKLLNMDLPSKLSSPVEELRQRVLFTLHRYPDHRALYTDGSKCGRKTGTGLYSQTNRMMFRLPDHTSIYIAELFAIYQAIELAQSDTHSNFVIFSDSMSALQSIQSGNQMGNFLLGKIISSLMTTNKSIILSWVPSHIGISGNEKADALAKSALENNSIVNIPTDLGTFNSILSTQLHAHWQSQWDNLQIPHKHKKYITDWPTSYRHNRREEIAIARLRMNSTYITHLDPYISGTFPPQCNTCNTTLSVRHILLHCTQYNTQRQTLVQHCRHNNIQFSVTNILADDIYMVDRIIFYLRTTGLLWKL